MSQAEDLYREMSEQERRDDKRFGQDQAMKEISKVKPREPDADKAMERYQREIAPVFEARRRIAKGLPPTRNPIVNLYLRLTGQDHIEELPESEIIPPSKGLVICGPTLEEVQKAIAADPKRFHDLTRAAPEVRPVQARRKTPEDLHQ